MKRFSPLFLVGFFFSLSIQLSFGQLEVIRYQLKNGFTVILNPDKTANNIFGAVTVNTGSKNDPIDATGISHYLEHLLFKGTDKLGTHNFEAEKPLLDSINVLYDKLGNTSDKDEREKIQLLINQYSVKASKYAMPNEFDRLVKQMGGTRVNATTSRDITWYYNTFPSHQVNKWLDLYAHRFTNPIFRSFQSELEVVYEEKNRARDNMQRRLFTSFDKSFYKDHPYGEKGTLGTIEHLKNPSLTKMYNYFNEYYVANNMALILSGNFKPEEVKPQIEKLFGHFKAGELPKNEIAPPQPFKGRELHKARITPIKVGLLGFRTVPRYHEDELALDIIANLLQNETGTGLVDQLEADNKVMNAWAFQSNENEAGQMMLIFIPKLFVQSFKAAENIMLAQIEKIKQGNFSDQQLQIVKNELYNNFQLGLESPEYRGGLYARLFAQNKGWDDIKNYPKRLETISKEEIQRVAQKYLDDNYMILHSRTGFSKNKKLEKPNFKAVKVDQSQKSEYAKHFEKIEEVELEPRFIDFDKDLDIIDLENKNELYAVQNPINDIYELSIRYKTGLIHESRLEVLSELMSNAYPEGSSRTEFKDKIGLLGSTYFFSASNSYFEITLNGIEKNFTKVLSLINELMENTKVDESSIKNLQNTYRTNYKAEREEPVTIAQALAQYGIVGKKSTALNRPSYKDIKKMNADELLAVLDSVTQFAISFHFTGKSSAKEVEKQIKENYRLSTASKSNTPYKLVTTDRKQNEIIIVNNKKLLQSSMFFVKNTPEFEMNQYPKMKLFNSYFGGGFSGLITQEIREYRSLAYSTAAKYRYQAHPKSKSLFYTYISCQADKTNEAVAVAFNLIDEMPKKEERMDMMRSNVKLSQFSDFPSFRSLSSTVEFYRNKGFTKDPNELSYDSYNGLQFDDIYQFYQENIQKEATFLGIYGDAKRFNIPELEKFGKVKILNLDEVITF